MRREYLQSIRFQLSLLLTCLLAVFAGASVYALDSAEKRRQEQVLVAATANLQLATNLMRQQALDYLTTPARDYPTYYRDVRLYYQDLLRHMDTFDRHLGAGGPVPWKPLGVHAGRHHAVVEAGRSWSRFREGLVSALGDDPETPRLEWAVEYIIDHGDGLEAATRALHRALEEAAMAGMSAHQRMIRISSVTALLIMLVAVWWLQSRVLRPLKDTSEGFKLVAQGNFGHRLPVPGRNEIGLMAESFNNLSDRLHALFMLIDRIQQAEDPERMLTIIWPDLETLVPMDWAGLILASPDGATATLEHAAYRGRAVRPAVRWFTIQDGQLRIALSEDRPLRIPEMGDVITPSEPLQLEEMLYEQELHSALILPIRGEHGNAGALVLACQRSNAYLLSHLSLMTNLAGLISSALRKTVLMENLVISAVEGLAKLAEHRDPETGDHLTRMRLYATIIAERLGEDPDLRDTVTPQFTRDVYRFAPMHDIGKVGIPDHVLLKEGKLSDDERGLMNRHPMIGGEVLRECEKQLQKVGFRVFQTAIEIAEGHHERFDGRGYPRGLQGDEIPLSARIVAVADVFDALTSRRPYKEAWPVERALAWLREHAGTQFDPRVVRAMLDSLSRIMPVYERFRHV